MSLEDDLTEGPPLNACSSFTRRIPQPENGAGDSSIRYFRI